MGLHNRKTQAYNLYKMTAQYMVLSYCLNHKLNFSSYCLNEKMKENVKEVTLSCTCSDCSQNISVFILRTSGVAVPVVQPITFFLCCLAVQRSWWDKNTN